METLLVFLNVQYYYCKSRCVQAIYKCCLSLNYSKKKKRKGKKRKSKLHYVWAS